MRLEPAPGTDGVAGCAWRANWGGNRGRADQFIARRGPLPFHPPSGPAQRLFQEPPAETPASQPVSYHFIRSTCAPGLSPSCSITAPSRSACFRSAASTCGLMRESPPPPLPWITLSAVWPCHRHSLTADVPIWLNMEAHGLEPPFYIPLEYLETGYLDPTTLSDPINTNQVFYSRNELARQVHARILIRRLPVRV